MRNSDFTRHLRSLERYKRDGDWDSYLALAASPQFQEGLAAWTARTGATGAAGPLDVLDVALGQAVRLAADRRRRRAHPGCGPLVPPPIRPAAISTPGDRRCPAALGQDRRAGRQVRRSRCPHRPGRPPRPAARLGVVR